MMHGRLSRPPTKKGVIFNIMNSSMESGFYVVQGASIMRLPLAVGYLGLARGIIAANIKQVIFNAPATIVMWEDGTKTVVKAQNGEIYDPEKGLAMAIVKKMYGNKGSYNEIFKKWLPKIETR